MNLIVLAAGNSSRIYKKIKMMKFLIKVDGISLIEKIILDAKKSRCFKRIKKITQKKNINFIKSFTDSDVEMYPMKSNLDMSFFT